MKPKLSTKIHSNLSSALQKKALPAVQKAVQSALPKAASRVSAFLVKQARSISASTGEAYERALAPSSINITNKGITITLADNVARAREHGMDAHDMKPYLLKHGRVGKNGTLYVDIPFSHSAKQVPKAIRQRLYKVSRVRMVTPGAVVKKKMHGKAFKMTVRHARGIFDDMMKRSGGGYATIRRVSTKSPSSSWWHPGFKGLNLIKKSEEEIRKIVKQTIAEELQPLGVKVKV